jgi:hypothetical protein
MLRLYILGAFVTFITGTYRILRFLAISRSTKARNLALIGLRFDPLRGTFLTGNQRIRWPRFILSTLLIEPLFSWFSVALSAWSIFHAWVNRVPVPERLKEMQYAIAVAPQSRESMRALASDFAAYYKVQPPEFDKNGNILTDEESYDRDELDLSTTEWTVEIRLDRAQKHYHYKSHPPEHDSTYKAVYEYRIEGTRVFERLLDEYGQAVGAEDQHDVKQNAIQEAEIRRRFEQYPSAVCNVDERLAELQRLVQWQEVPNCKIKYFILSRHPERLPAAEARRFFEQELQRIQSGADAVTRKAQGLGLAVGINDGGLEFAHPSTVSPEAQSFYESVRRECIQENWNLTYYELHSAPELTSYLKQLLGSGVMATTLGMG